MKALYLLATFSLLSFASCTDEAQELADEQSQVLKQIVMTTQDFQSEVGSRTLYEIGEAVKCTWAANDTVGVFPDEGAQAYFPMALGAGTKNATFDGKGWALKDGYTYGAYYPFIGAMYLDRNAVPVSYSGQAQVGNASTAHLGAFDFMVASPAVSEFGSAQFIFKHLSSLVQLRITVPQPATLTSVKLVTDTETFAVEGEVDIMADVPGITSTKTAKEIVLSLQDVATTEENQVVTLYMMLPPVDLSEQTLKAVIASDKGTQEIALEGRNFKAGFAYGLSGAIEGEDVIGDGSYKDGVVSLAEAGTMKKLLGKDYLSITSLKVVGPINGDDVYCLRKMLGSKDSNGEDRGKLTTLDLSKASIVEGGGWYYEYLYDDDVPFHYTSNDVIGDYMFFGCTNLTEIVLPKDAVLIGNCAFNNCESLTSVTIGDYITSVGNNAVGGCSALSSVYITDLSSWCKIAFTSYGSNPLINGAKLYLNGEELIELIIPEDIKEVKEHAFHGCTSLVRVIISDNIISIGNFAFSGCSSLTFIDIPDNVTSMGNAVFSGCSSLNSVNIPTGVTSIGYSAFSGCSSLTFIDIPDNVTSIGDFAFSDCSSLTFIDIPDNVVSIGYNAFSGCASLTSINIPDNVTSLGNNAFSNCIALNSVSIGDGILSIGMAAFSGCSSLTFIDIPDNVTSIGHFAFYGCDALASITIGEGVTSIGQQAFSDCNALADLYCYAIIPPTINISEYNSSFDSYGDNTILHVPERCGTKYKSSDWAKYFKTIKEM